MRIVLPVFIRQIIVVQRSKALPASFNEFLTSMSLSFVVYRYVMEVHQLPTTLMTARLMYIIGQASTCHYCD